MLRRLLLSPEQTEIEALRSRLDDPALHARDVSRVLAEAIVLRAREDEELVRALKPIFAQTLRAAVKDDPELIAEAVYPIIGPAIRKAVASALRELVESLNRVLAQAFSPRALRWRLEAWRTGRPFAEIVLLRTLVYRIEQLFLVHRATGLVLQHLTAPGVESEDPDLVAAMLSAIQDFVRDSFGAGEHEALDELQVGELVVWIERSPDAVLAAVIRGAAPSDVRALLQEQLERIQGRFAEELRAFSGDAEQLSGSRALLEECFLAEYGDRDGRAEAAVSTS